MTNDNIDAGDTLRMEGVTAYIFDSKKFDEDGAATAEVVYDFNFECIPTIENGVKKGNLDVSKIVTTHEK